MIFPATLGGLVGPRLSSHWRELCGLAGRSGRARWPRARRPRCGEHRRAQLLLSGRQPLLLGLLQIPRPACSAVCPGCTNSRPFVDVTPEAIQLRSSPLIAVQSSGSLCAETVRPPLRFSRVAKGFVKACPAQSIATRLFFPICALTGEAQPHRFRCYPVRISRAVPD